MKGNKPVLIVEHSTSGLEKINESVNVKGEKQYLMSGNFTKFSVKNRNERIYEAAGFLPHMNELLQRKAELGVVYGEMDHPDVFDTSMTKISHTIETLVYNQPSNSVDGQIRLLNTKYGKEAKALVDDNCPIFVSSRAAGVTESNGTVTVKKLFTYDIVADPGFGTARVSLNESLGYVDKTNFRIYDISDESKINELFAMNNNNDYVTKNQMVEYSEYLKKEIVKLQNRLTESAKQGVMEPEKIEKMSEIYENMQAQQTKLAKYLDYLANTVQIVVNENKELKSKTSKLVEHNDYLATNLEKTIKYSKYIAETLDRNIDFGEHIAENLNKNIDFADYLAENLEKTIDYSEYIAEHLDNNIVYAEYLAENLDNNIQYGEYLAEHVEKNIDYAEYIAENLDNNIVYAEYIAEHVDNNVLYAEYIAENLSDSQAYTKYLAEGLDQTLEFLKDNKINENEVINRIPNMKVDDVTRFYKDEEDEEVQPVKDVTTIDEPAQPVQSEIQPSDEPIQGEIQPTTEEPEVQPVQGEVQTEVQPVQGELTNPVNAQDMMSIPTSITTELPASVEGQPVTEIEIVPGATVSVENQTGEVLAYNPQTKLVVVQLASDNSTVEVHESKVMIIGDKLLENEDSLKSYISGLITETKKRKASETQEPHYLNFLTEKNKNIWRNLTAEEKEQITYAINESADPIFSESDVITVMQKTLFVEEKPFETKLMENMPSDLKGIWKQINEKQQQSILSAAKLYPNLNSDAKMESFWNTRGLEKYLSLNESKKALNENKFVDNSNLSDEQIEKFISKIKNLG